MSTLRFNEYVFVIPSDSPDVYILYAPLHEVAVRIGGVVASAVRNILQMQSVSEFFVPSSGFEAEVYSGVFRRLGLLELPEKWEKKLSLANKEKSRVTLSLTNKCNLRCIYCSADTGNSQVTMDFQLAKDSIDVAVDHAIRNGNTCFEIKFHGGGEVFMEYNLMKKCVEYVKHKAHLHKLHPHLRAVSNVTLITDEVAAWLKENDFFITASVDGKPEIQDLHRPYASGKGSFTTAIRGLKSLKDAGVQFEIRATVTNFSVRGMRDFVQHVADTIFCGEEGKIHFEPLTICGRAEENGLEPVDTEVFLHEYSAARELGKMVGVEVVCSFDTFSYLKQRHCGTSMCSMFCVAPHGGVSACSRITKPTDRGAETFFYGEYNRNTGKFDIEPVSVLEVISASALPLEECLTCFARWGCQGHCPVARYEDSSYCDPACTMVKSLLISRLQGTVR